MYPPRLREAIWRKSSYSGQGGNCLEIADAATTAAAIPVRDSKNPHGPALVFATGAWAVFVSHVKGAGLPR
ncbi:DUF397 domain-containing protein [Streptomyces telluris]|uniref:DUF397 domain-containing protein n=1 Tax=Streptomyces telluris TaxID=2720021 RepID=A0A9X2LMW9_9ACTN|nr:DUF397 domain-containing protein [Streptomyces telluris]MCQ8772550.1 DUF397 domain-containing protein [Streptomyces telluris]NJP76332.1 DUF397 domain-containing protein [Streptomyces telluris]